MNLPRSIAACLVLLLSVTTYAQTKTFICPIGFRLATTKQKHEPICYRRKGPETFSDKFKNCAGNLYTSELYQSLDINFTDGALWTEYKSLYSGGSFVDWSYTDTIGNILTTSFDVHVDPAMSESDLCVAMDPVTNFTAVRCDEEHYRYCLVPPYDLKDFDSKGCPDKDYIRFSSPVSTCLMQLKGSSGGRVRTTWMQAQALCMKRDGSLMNRGWRFSNNPLLSMPASEPEFPLGVKYDIDSNQFNYVIDDEVTAQVPLTERNFIEKVGILSNDTVLGAINREFWQVVNSAHVFYNAICERTLQPRSVNLHVSVDIEGKLILKVNDTVDKDDIYCFSDSVTHYPSSVVIEHDRDSELYVLKPLSDGYYWCSLINSKDFTVADSNHALFIRSEQSMLNVYAVKLHLSKRYAYRNLDELVRKWEKILREYIFYRTVYEKVYGEMTVDTDQVEEVLRKFKNTHHSDRQSEVVQRLTVKKLFVNAMTAVVHVTLKPDYSAVKPGTWDDMRIEYMRPVYFCKDVGSGSAPSNTPYKLGAWIAKTGCVNSTCIGNFNDGVQWVDEKIAECTFKDPIKLSTKTNVPDYETRYEPPTTSESLEDTSTEMPTTVPSNKPPLTWPDTTETINVTIPELTITPEPETTTSVVTSVPVVTSTPVVIPTTQTPDYVQDVLDELESLLNSTGPIVMGDINNSIEQVDMVLEETEDGAIPGQMLHLLDNLGSRIDLEGNHSGQVVFNNIALLVADAAPESPCRGMKLSTRDADQFNPNAFEILDDVVGSSNLTTDRNEAVVHLPASVSVSGRRISFVVFRNNRAFQPAASTIAVNSRVLSINVENLTEFQHGEVIDIHLRPLLGDVNRNESRTCAYWHFEENGTGYWSQEGCTLLRATAANNLDTCRCDHLTHFAEVLVPRVVFSENNETALELISVVGCILSIIGVFMVCLTGVMFRSWRRDYSNKIWLQLCVSILIRMLCFLIIVYVRFTTYDPICMIVGIVLHYSALASFCWMVVAAVLSYRRLVTVFSRDASHKLLRASVFAWGLPFAIIGILLSVSPQAYAGQFQDMVPSGAFCYPSGLGLWLSVYAPIALMLLANGTLFALIVRSVFASTRIQRHGDKNEALRCGSVSFLLFFLFGLPWIFGLFGTNIVAAYLFCLTAALQGFVLFIFFVLGNKKTRDLWLNKLKIKQTRKVPVTSSTYTNRSTAAPPPARAAGPATMEANSSKPKSLYASDNSRFS